MYQKFNESKNRWQKFDKNGKLLGTKKNEGKYVKIPTFEEFSDVKTEETKAENVSEENATSNETATTDLTESSKVEELTSKASKKEPEKAEPEKAEPKTSEKAPEKKESVRSQREAVKVADLSLKEHLIISKMELLDMGAFSKEGIQFETLISKQKFEQLIGSCCVRNLV